MPDSIRAILPDPRARVIAAEEWNRRKEHFA